MYAENEWDRGLSAEFKSGYRRRNTARWLTRHEAFSADRGITRRRTFMEVRELKIGDKTMIDATVFASILTYVPTPPVELYAS